MLFAKDFKTAVAVVIAVAGLLGFGTANAGALLSENGNGEAGTVPAFFAAELYPALLTSGSKNGAEVIATSTAAHKLYAEVGSLSADGTSGGVDTALLSGTRYFVRLDLSGGAQFGSGFVGTGGDSPVQIRYGAFTAQERVYLQRVRSGRTGDDYGIWTFTVGTNGSNDANPAVDNEVDDLIEAGRWTVFVDGIRYNGIRLPRSASATERNCYDLKFRLYDSSTDARNEREPMVTASGTLLCLVPVVDAKVAGAQTLTASVAEGFRRFTGDSPTSGRLATATVTVATKEMACGSACPATAARRMIPVQHPDGSDMFAADDVLESVEVSLTGSFSHSTPFGFGEFKLGTATMDRLDADDEEISAEANKTAEGKAMTAKVMGKVEEPGTYHISVDVSSNNASSDTNVYEAIGQGTYKAAWDIDIVGDATPDGGSDVTAGTIMRDGTSVRLGYLQTITSMERDGNTIGWNQRLIVTNHGSIASDVTLGDFKAEGDAEVMCKAADMDNPLHMMDGEPMWTCSDDGDTVMTTIGANSQMVLRVADIIEGAKRTAGTITIAQDDSQISIASSHVTLPGGQTDTVRYWPLQ